MSVISVVVLIFSVLGALDKIFGNKFGLGAEFEKGFKLFVPMTFSMLGILVIAPAVGAWLTPFFEWIYSVFKIDPSVIPASIFANDMGGVTLSTAVCKNEEIGKFNAYIVSSMMGCVISFTIPFAIGLVKKEQHRDMFFGMLCGIITIPIGCFVAGLMCGLPFGQLMVTLLPLIIFSAIVAVALILFTNVCIRIFSAFGVFMKIVAMVGLLIGIFTFLTKIKLSNHFDTFENAAFVCVNACVTLSGALPFMYLVTKLFDRPVKKLGSKIGIDSVSALALLSTIVTNAYTFGVMERMNKKGVVLNCAFAVSAAFTIGGHLAYTMAFDQTYVAPMIVGKLISGICAVLLAMVLYKDEN